MTGIVSRHRAAWPAPGQGARRRFPRRRPGLALSIQETYQEQKEELLAQNSNVTVNKFQLTCPVCREPIGATHPKHC